MKREFQIQGCWVPARLGIMNGRFRRFLKQGELSRRWEVPLEFLEKKKSELCPTHFGAERKYSLAVIQTLEGDILELGRA
jgi:hypothetical protein